MTHPVPKPIVNCIYGKGADGQRVDHLPTADISEGKSSPDDLVGRSFRLDPDEETDEKLKTNSLRDCHDPLERLEKQSFKQDGKDLFRLMSVTAHQGPLMPQDPEYMGSAWNTLVNWEDGSKTYEPLHLIGKDHPDLCAQLSLIHI